MRMVLSKRIFIWKQLVNDGLADDSGFGQTAHIADSENMLPSEMLRLRISG